MDSISQNIQNPEWWFTGIFFIVIGIAISKIFKSIPSFLKGIARKIRKRNLTKIKVLRQSQYNIQYQINSENRYFIGFIVIGFLYLLLFSISPFRVLLKDHFWFVMLLTTPLYISEITWLNKKAFIEALIKSANKLTKSKNCYFIQTKHHCQKNKSNSKKIRKRNKSITRHSKQGLA